MNCSIHWLIIIKFAINKYRLQISKKKKLKIDELMKYGMTTG